MLDYAKKVGNIEKSVIDLNSKFDNITNKFKMVSDEHRETRENKIQQDKENGNKNRIDSNGNIDKKCSPVKSYLMPATT